MGHFEPTNDIALLGTIDPDAYNSGAQNSDWVDMEYFESLFATMYVGILQPGATATFKLQEATTSTGGSAADISGKTVTALTTASNDKQAIIDVRAGELSSGFRYVRAVMTLTSGTGGAAGDAAVGIYGYKCKSGPASGHDLASVAQIA